MDFYGETPLSVDVKHRIILPTRYRAPLASAFLTLGESKPQCLALWPPDALSGRSREMQEKAKGSDDEQWEARRFFATIQPVQPDAQGRVGINQQLRERAGVNGEVLLVGQLDHFEIWDPATYRREMETRFP